MSRGRRRRESGILLLAFAAFCALAVLLVGRNLSQPGPYYDEVIQANATRELLAADGRPPELPGARAVRVLGRWWPVMTQSYMGALKSQALVPSFALFGATPETLRATTLAFGLVGLLFAMLLARELLGLPAALVTGALLASDPAFLFASRHDWGSFALGMATRCAGLALALQGFRGGSGWRAGLAGLLLGLGFYNKIDFAITWLAAGGALLLAAPGELRAALGRRRPARAFGAGLLLGAAPMLAALPGALRATDALARAAGERPDWGEKLAALGAALDGSYFERLLSVGGRFEELAGSPATSVPLLPALYLVAAAALALRVLRAGPRRSRAEVFALAVCGLALAGVALMPRAVRLHHVLGILPFPQLLVGAAAAALWRVPGGALRLRRFAVAGVLAAALGVQLAADLRTLEAIARCGGTGRWSGALAELASELRDQAGVAGAESARVVSLDWGLHAPLRFLDRGLSLREPIWRLWLSPRGFEHHGTPGDLYLAHAAPDSVFDFGPAFLEAARRLPPGVASFREHRDGCGGLAFLSVRIARPHALLYRHGRGSFEVRLR